MIQFEIGKFGFTFTWDDWKLWVPITACGCKIFYLGPFTFEWLSDECKEGK
jgi:hypothetical protein